MSGSGDDTVPGGSATPGGEPAPAELWFTGDPDLTAPQLPDPSPGAPPGGGGRPGRPGRTRWIALALGSAVLVAVIAAQHFAGGTSGASTAASSASSTTPATAGSRPRSAPAAPTRSAAVSEAAPSGGRGSTDRSSAGSSIAGSDSAVDLPPDGIAVSTVITVGTGRVPVGAPRRTHGAHASAPVTTTVPTQVLPVTGDWELVGYGAAGVVTYRPATGRVVITPVPPVGHGIPLSFVATETAAIVRPLFSSVTGYLVLDGKPATTLTGAVGNAQEVLPGPDPGHLWIVTDDGERTSLALVRGDGSPSGATITLPPVLSTGAFSITTDGDGYALVTGVGGTYDARPDGLHLVTHGRVLAAGPTAFLVEQCDTTARCDTAVIDRRTGTLRTLAHLPPSVDYQAQGTISPNGRYAALVQSPYSGPTVVLIDLTTGKARTLSVDVDAVGIANDTSTVLAFTPDSRDLLVADGRHALTPVDTRTGDLLTPLPLPPLSAIAVLPAS